MPAFLLTALLATSSGAPQAESPRVGPLIAPRWSATVPYAYYQAATVDAGKLYIAGSPHVIAMSRRNGKVLWRAEISPYHRDGRFRSAVVGKDLVAARFRGDGVIDVFDTASGKIRGTLTFKEQTVEGLKVVDGRILACLRSLDGASVRLGALDLSGTPAFVEPAPGELLAKMGAGYHVFGGELFEVMKVSQRGAELRRVRFFDPPVDLSRLPFEIYLSPDRRIALVGNRGSYDVGSIIGAEPSLTSRFINRWRLGNPPLLLGWAAPPSDVDPGDQTVKTLEARRRRAVADPKSWLIDGGGIVSWQMVDGDPLLIRDLSLNRVFTVAGVTYGLTYPNIRRSDRGFPLWRRTREGGFVPIGELADASPSESGGPYYYFLPTEAGLVRIGNSTVQEQRIVACDWFPLPR